MRLRFEEKYDILKGERVEGERKTEFAIKLGKRYSKCDIEYRDDELPVSADSVKLTIPIINLLKLTCTWNTEEEQKAIDDAEIAEKEKAAKLKEEEKAKKKPSKKRVVKKSKPVKAERKRKNYDAEEIEAEKNGIDVEDDEDEDEEELEENKYDKGDSFIADEEEEEGDEEEDYSPDKVAEPVKQKKVKLKAATPKAPSRQQPKRGSKIVPEPMPASSLPPKKVVVSKKTIVPAKPVKPRKTKASSNSAPKKAKPLL